MKILLVNTVSLNANGISTFIINSAKLLSKRKNKVSILASNNVDKRIKEDLANNKIDLKIIKNRKSNPIKYFVCVKKYLSRENFDIVHVNGNSTIMFIELFAAKMAKVKGRIAHSHNTTTEHPLINYLLRPMFEYSVNGRLACNISAGKWLFKNKSFEVVPNGIDLSIYDFNLNTRLKYREKMKIKSNEILLGHVGYFNYQKNQTFLIDLLHSLPANYKLVLIGNGSEYKNVKKKAKSLGINKRIIFTNTVNNVQDYLNAVDIFLLPSKFEGQPFVIIEALANGLPCVISNNVSEEIDVSKNSYFVPLQLQRWNEKIQGIEKSDREKRSLDNQECLKESGYDINQIGQILEKYYLSAIKN